MKADAVVRARVSADLKREAAVILAACGLTISDAIRLMLMHTVQDGDVPFPHIIPNEKTLAAMRESLAGGWGKSINSVEELMADLHADD